MLENCPVLASHPRELSVVTAFSIHSKSVDCLLPVLALKPALERNDHLSFCEAVRTDQTHIAALLIDYHYRARSEDRPDMLHAALNKGMGWVGTPLTLHYLLTAGGSMLYFDWDYYASRSEERISRRRAAEMTATNEKIVDESSNSSSIMQCLANSDSELSESGDSSSVTNPQTDVTGSSESPEPLKSSIYRDLVNVLIQHLSLDKIDLEDFAEEALFAAASRGDIDFLDALITLGLDLSEGVSNPRLDWISKGLTWLLLG
jgi:hypothetical protein